MNCWIIKSEPFKYSWDMFVAEGKSIWDGVRNYQARNNMMAMKMGDFALFYHSNAGKEIVGLAKVIKEHYPDPTTDDPRWVVVEFEPIQKFTKPISLAYMKTDERLANLPLIKQGRLSVLPIKQAEFDLILGLGI
jgi:predicted RNA-binding protein with PUA-like domain